ncbi:MAG: HYR domain-containing protein, partial [Paludibacteraceae bacterium]|nr:HYR domain-containing protein [Paludibacteraceae bacterium]
VECVDKISVIANEMCMAKGVEIQLPKVTENCSTPYALTATRSDGADMVLPKVGDKTAGDFFVGTTTIVWTAADAVPNSASCTTTVVVTEDARNVNATHIICDLASYDEADAKAEIERLYPDYVVTIGTVENLGDVEENGVKVPTRTYGFSLKHQKATDDYATCTYSGTLTVKATKPVELLNLSHTVCDTSVFDAVAATKFIASKTGTVYDVSEVKDAKEDGVKKFTYTLTGKANAADCKYEDGVLLVGEYPAITISPSIADICEGGNVEVVDLPASGVVWDGDFSGFDEAVGYHRYDYVYTDGNGCKLDSFLSYTVHALPQISVVVKQGSADISGGGKLCPSMSGDLSMEIVINNAITGKDTIYEWNKQRGDKDTIVDISCGMTNNLSYVVVAKDSVSEVLTCASDELIVTVPFEPAPSLVCHNGDVSYILPDDKPFVTVPLVAPDLVSCSGYDVNFKLLKNDKDSITSDNWDLTSLDLGMGRYTVVYETNDACLVEANNNVCEWEFVVADEGAPTVICGDTMKFFITEGGTCDYTLKADEVLDLPSFSDNGGSKLTVYGMLNETDRIDVSVSGSDTTYTPTNITFNKGENKIVWTVVDASGNPAGCDQYIFVYDKVAPSIVCKKDTTVEAGADCAATVELTVPVATDNCSVVSVVGTRDDGKSLSEAYTLRTTVVTWVATDGAGNTSECKQTVTVVDNTDPVIMCGNDTTVEAGADCAATVELTVPVATDNCSVVSVVGTRDDG